MGLSLFCSPCLLETMFLLGPPVLLEPPLLLGPPVLLGPPLLLGPPVLPGLSLLLVLSLLLCPCVLLGSSLTSLSLVRSTKLSSQLPIDFPLQEGFLSIEGRGGGDGERCEALLGGGEGLRCVELLPEGDGSISPLGVSAVVDVVGGLWSVELCTSPLC